MSIPTPLPVTTGQIGKTPFESAYLAGNNNRLMMSKLHAVGGSKKKKRKTRRKTQRKTKRRLHKPNKKRRRTYKRYRGGITSYPNVAGSSLLPNANHPGGTTDIIKNAFDISNQAGASAKFDSQIGKIQQ
jgi:hypothetical protein